MSPKGPYKAKKSARVEEGDQLLDGRVRVDLAPLDAGHRQIELIGEPLGSSLDERLPQTLAHLFAEAQTLARPARLGVLRPLPGAVEMRRELGDSAVGLNAAERENLGDAASERTSLWLPSPVPMNTPTFACLSASGSAAARHDCAPTCASLAPTLHRVALMP